MLIEMFSYSFIIKALIVGILIALCCSLLGVTLVLKRCSMIGDGLSHVGFGALAVASVFNSAPLAVALPIVIAAAFFLLNLSKSERLNGDSAIALVSTSSLALGVIAISAFTKGNSELSAYLFGSILAVSDFDLYLSVILCVCVMLIFVFLYTRIFAVTFDETFAFATGTNVSLYNSLIAVLTAVTVVLGMKMVGTLLISALIIFPALTSMRIYKTFLGVTVSSAVISVICFLGGFIISYLFELPTGAAIVVFNLICFILFLIAEKIIKK